MNDRPPRRPPLGLGDLVRAVVTLRLDEAQTARAAAMMGLRPAPPPEPSDAARTAEPQRPSKRRAPPSAAIEPEPPATPPLDPDPTAELSLEKRPPTTNALPAFLETAPALTDTDLAETDALPLLAPLFEPAWQRSLLGAVLATETLDGPIDVDRLVDVAARRRAVDRLPRRPRWTLRRGARVLVDEGEAMMPFAGDVAQICAGLVRLAGGAPVQILGFDGDPSSTWGEDGDRRSPDPPPRGTPVLALTDLGLRDPACARPWLRFAEQMRRAGCPLLALVPYPRSRWPRALVRSIAIAAWDRRTRVGAVRRAARAASTGAR